MLQNAYFLAKIGADTAENEQHFAEILPKIGNYPTGPPGLPSEGISSMALLKMLKHGRAGVPMEVMGLMLGEFIDDYTVRSRAVEYGSCIWYFDFEI